MYCPKCGAQVNDSAQFCASCGSALGAQPNLGAFQANVGGYKPVVPNYLVWNILATLFCCLPFGIAGIVSSSKVDSAVARGDYNAAQEASSKAKGWLIASIVCWGIAVFAYIALVGLGVALEDM